MEEPNSAADYILARGDALKEAVEKGKYDDKATQDQRDTVAKKIAAVHSAASRVVRIEGGKQPFPTYFDAADERLNPISIDEEPL